MARLESHFEPNVKGEGESPFNEADRGRDAEPSLINTEIGRLGHRLCCSAKGKDSQPTREVAHARQALSPGLAPLSAQRTPA
jgi:hypothetical protein